MRRTQLRAVEMTRKIRDRHARRLVGNPPQKVIAFYRAAGETAMNDARRRTKRRKGGA